MSEFMYEEYFCDQCANIVIPRFDPKTGEAYFTCDKCGSHSAEQFFKKRKEDVPVDNLD
jgi:DNA-directed RNA polymerase subunit M/transcription elongation factor TFIIS